MSGPELFVVTEFDNNKKLDKLFNAIACVSH